MLLRSNDFAGKRWEKDCSVMVLPEKIPRERYKEIRESTASSSA
jgi:hypothetical protein